MSSDMRIAASDLDLGRFDDPLYAEPRVGFGGGAGWISFGFARGSQSPSGFRLGYVLDGLKSFVSEEDARRCAQELAAVFERYGVETRIRAE